MEDFANTTDLNMEMNISNNGSLNGTEEFKTPVLKSVIDVLLIIIVLFIMIAMGCTITVKEIWKHLRTPISIIIGMVSQFAILPLCSFGLSYAVGLSSNVAIGLLVLSCCPGGTMSNLFTYWLDGDVSLSITMTTCSTILAFGMMPLNLFIYSSGFVSEDVNIPYLKIFITLLSIIGPVIIGMLAHAFKPEAARIFSKIGSFVGMFGILASLIIQSILFPEMYTSKWNVWFSAASFPIIGFFSGFILAKLTKREAKVVKAIAFETGSQNVALAMTVLFLTFPFDVLGEATAFPQLYAVIMLTEYGLSCLAYNVYLKFFSKKKDIDIDEEKNKGAVTEIRMPMENVDKTEIEKGTYGTYTNC